MDLRFWCLWIAALGFAPVWAQSANWEFEQVLQGESLPIGTMLSWSTAYEEGLAAFTVERSDDGSTFREVGIVTATGQSQEIRHYNFLDVTPLNSTTVYYRLKVSDEDGGYTYSEVITLQNRFDNQFMVADMSNVVVEDFFQLTIEAFTDGTLHYTLTDVRGHTMMQDQMIIIKGLNDLTIDLSSQPEGIYKLNLRMGVEEEQLVITHRLDELVKKPNVATKTKATDKH